MKIIWCSNCRTVIRMEEGEGEAYEKCNRCEKKSPEAQARRLMEEDENSEQ